MATTPRQRLRCNGHRGLSLALLAAVVALVAFGAREGSVQEASSALETSPPLVPTAQEASVPAPIDAPARVVQAPSTSSWPPTSAPVPATPASNARANIVQATPAPSPFELVGTGINGTDAFAVLRNVDQGTVTVHQGNSAGAYTIARIEPERVTLKSPGGDEQVLMLVPATGAVGKPATAASDSAAEAVANTGLIAERINTDQSIPEHVMFGPTASLPAGVKQVGH